MLEFINIHHKEEQGLIQLKVRSCDGLGQVSIENTQISLTTQNPNPIPTPNPNPKPIPLYQPKPPRPKPQPNKNNIKFELGGSNFLWHTLIVIVVVAV